LKGTFGSKCVFFTWADDPRGPLFLKQTGVQPVATVDEAEFLLAHGTQGIWTPGGSESDLIPIPYMFETGNTEGVDGLLREAVAKGIKVRMSSSNLTN
jgi:hypothetical protein